MKYSTEQLGEMIKKERLKRNWSQKKLGKKLGLSDRQISKYENGEQTPPIETIFRFCKSDIFDCELGYLLGEDDYKAGTKDETFVQNYTGLSHDALHSVLEINGKAKSHRLLFKHESEKSSKILNNLLTTSEFLDIIEKIDSLNNAIENANNVIPKYKKKYGQDVWDEGYSIEYNDDSSLNNFDGDMPKLTKEQLKAHTIFIKGIEKKMECAFYVKVIRYEIQESMRDIINILYPPMCEEQNEIS